MVDLWTADYTNFKWNRHDDHSFVVLYNNKFTLYGIKEVRSFIIYNAEKLYS